MDKNQKFFVLFGVFVIIVVALLVFYYFAISDDKEFTVRDEDSFTSQQEYLNYLEEYKQAMSKDTYGGKTPEETLQLFVDALKKGDTELASKYFVLDKQKEMANDLKQGIESGGADTLIDYYSNGSIEKTYFDVDGSYEFEILKEKNQPGFIINFLINKATNLWKIESL